MNNIEAHWPPLANRILFEDNHLIAINKIPGELAQQDKEGNEDLTVLMKQLMKDTYNKPGNVFMGLIHRIDRPVSGVLLFAKTDKALSRMTVAFREREVKKVYHALVRGIPTKDQATLQHYLIKNQEKNTTKAFLKEVRNSKFAELFYETAVKGRNNSLLHVFPITGRSHQIRVQLASIGCPIVGDIKYGPKPINPDWSICLHAAELHFVHPVKKEPLSIYAPKLNERLWETRLAE